MNSPQQNAASALGGSEEAARADTIRVDAQNPWPGLDAYNEASSKFFHGRNAEAAELLRLINLAPLTVVYGKSGLGKTSLLQAGLFPSLRAEHYLPVLVRLDFAAEIKNPPLQQVKQRLKEALDSVKAEYPAFEADDSLWEYLHRKDAEFWSTDNFPLTPVVVFDQFEELFSRTDGSDKLVEQVLDGLADLIENRIPAELAQETAGPRRSRLDLLSQRYRIVLSFREDFLPEVRRWEKRVPSLLRSSLRLEPMSRECAIETVVRSGKTVLEDGEAASSALDTLKQCADDSVKLSAKTVLENSVAASIVDLVGKGERRSGTTDASAAVAEPVLLSLCCTQLNKRRAAGTRIDKKLVDSAGQDILATFYRDALKDDDVKGEPDAAIFIEEYLIQGDFRGDYPKQEALDQNKLRSEQLAALTDRHRLLRIVYRGDTARIELIHDRIVPVVRASKDSRRQREAAEQARATLLQTQTKLRRSRLATIAFAVLTLLALGTAGWAVWEQRQAAQAIVRAKNQQKKAIENAERADLAEKRAKDSAERNEKFLIELSKAARAVRNSKDFRHALESLEATLKNVEATKAASEEAGVAELLRKAQAGDSYAMLDLGVDYYRGAGVAKDFQQAISWFRRAADAGSGTAMYNLGVMYEHGFGIRQDHSQAVSWYRKAADNGSAEGLNNLAWEYATSSDPAIRNPKAALEYALKAVEAGLAPDPNHLDTLAEAYYVNEKYQDAVKTEQRAIALASPEEKADFQKHLEKYQRALDGHK